MTNHDLLKAYTESTGALRGATEFNAPAPRSTWAPLEAQHAGLQSELLRRMADSQRHEEAHRDYHESCGAVRALRLVCRGLHGLPRTQGEVRAEVRFWLACARRAKQTIVSTS